jgi:hypothetical protein|tara:strand:+ start:7221 stop:7580 length:360 start_codon:yes stop_codon:yes gene_type:complete
MDELERDEAERVQAERANRVAVMRADYEYNLMCRVLDTEHGRALVHLVLREAGVHHTSAVPGDPHMTYFNEGKRQIGLLMEERVFTSAPEAYTIMCREFQEREDRLAARAEAAREANDG